VKPNPSRTTTLAVAILAGSLVVSPSFAFDNEAAEHTVNERRAAQNQNMSLPAVPLSDSGDLRALRSVAFAHLKSTAEVTGTTLHPQFAFIGKDASERERIIDLSDVAAFRVVRLDTSVFGYAAAVVDVVRFPTLTPGQLLDRRPSFQTLVNNHQEVIRLTINLETPAGELYLVGKTAGKDQPSPGYQVAVRLRDVQLYKLVRLEPAAAPWWATPSVVGASRRQ
jgi:hypothetical protein